LPESEYHSDSHHIPESNEESAESKMQHETSHLFGNEQASDSAMEQAAMSKFTCSYKKRKQQKQINVLWN